MKSCPITLSFLPLLSLTLLILTISAAGPAGAATTQATVHTISALGVGPSIGTVTFTDTRRGLLIKPDLSGLTPGSHGFHIHDKGNCGPALNQGQQAAGFAAGAHYDPFSTHRHRGPFRTDGHSGDLPVLLVGAGGKATHAVLAPHLKVSEVHGRSVMIHAGGDNYSDKPLPLGGGGARIACGVIP